MTVTVLLEIDGVCMKNNKYIGFTLTEVLISLAIIGVIAALSVPALLRNTNDTKLKVAYKKAFAQANNAILAAGDDSSSQMLSPIEAYSTDSPNGPQGKIILANFKAFRSQFKVIHSCDDYLDINKCWVVDPSNLTKYNGAPMLAGSGVAGFVSADGMYWASFVSLTDNTAKSGAFVDINASKPPNALGKDVFPLRFLPQGGTETSAGVPVQVLPVADVTVADGVTCHSAPCLFSSWLSGD